MKIVTYYTSGTPYEKQVEVLIASAQRHGEKVEAIAKDTRGGWVANCAAKARVCMDSYTGKESLLWLDADSQIIGSLDFFRGLEAAGSCDVATARLGPEFLSGTVYFGSSGKALSVIRHWVKLCDSQAGVWDQKHLGRAILLGQQERGVRYLTLPDRFCFRVPRGLENDWGAATPPGTVIVQHQRSRIFKAKVGP